MPVDIIVAEDATQPTGLGLPLLQLEIALGAAVAVLLLATAWFVRRARRWSP